MTEPRVGLKRGYYLLNTDGGNSGDPLGRAAIGALLRTRRLVTVDQISKAIGPATHNVAEYRALIEGLKLARNHGVQRIRVYMDSELVVDQVNGVSAVRQAHLRELHEVARSRIDLFKSIRISWVPREWNAEADQLVRDALGAAAVSVAGGVPAPTDRRPHMARTSASADATAATPAVPAPLSFQELPADALCAYLLAKPTIPDTAWKARFGSPDRLPRETRAAFVVRVLRP
jgi:probable phosphoglycerate mutase